MRTRHAIQCLFRLQTGFLHRPVYFNPHLTTVANYKSQYNVEQLYPNSNLDFISKRDTIINKYATRTEEFKGYIPVDKIQIKYMRGSGPGGQNVNKVNTKVEVRFHLDRADWIPQWIRERLHDTERGRINKDGELIVTSDKTRKQLLNQADCLDKIRTMIFNSSRVEQEPSEEDIKLKEARVARAKRGILLEKREKSLKKQSRQPPSAHNV